MTAPPGASGLSRLRRDPFAQAAAAYLAYGVVYFAGAVAGMTPDRARAFHGVPWWVFFVLGAAMLVVVPWLVLRRHVWFTRLIALGPAAKAFSLLAQQGRAVSAGEGASAFRWAFAAVAIVAAAMLLRAGWGAAARRPRKQDAIAAGPSAS